MKAELKRAADLVAFQRREALARLEDGMAQVAIGTHALISARASRAIPGTPSGPATGRS